MYNNSCGTSMDNQNKPLGILYISHGLFYFPFYIPCLIAIATKPLNTTPCYQIMSSMAVLDLMNLTIGALVCGYWSIIGFSYCGNVLFMKVFGAFTNGAWFAYCAYCITLAVNRWYAMGTSSNSEQLFSNGKTRYWILVCFFYGFGNLVLYLTPYATLVYNSGVGVYMFNPISNNMIAIAVNSVNNISTAILLFIFYTMIAVRSKRAASMVSNQGATAEELSVLKTKRTITTQCWCICVAAGLTCFSYSIVPLITNKIWAFQLTTLFWQMTQGINGIIYLTLNKTIRHRVRDMLKMPGGQVAPIVSKTTKPHHTNVVLEEDY